MSPFWRGRPTRQAGDRQVERRARTVGGSSVRTTGRGLAAAEGDQLPLRAAIAAAGRIARPERRRAARAITMSTPWSASGPPIHPGRAGQWPDYAEPIGRHRPITCVVNTLVTRRRCRRRTGTHRRRCPRGSARNVCVRRRAECLPLVGGHQERESLVSGPPAAWTAWYMSCWVPPAIRQRVARRPDPIDPEQVAGQDERPEHVIGDPGAGVAQDLRVTRSQPEHASGSIRESMQVSTASPRPAPGLETAPARGTARRTVVCCRARRERVLVTHLADPKARRRGATAPAFRGRAGDARRHGAVGSGARANAGPRCRGA